MKRILGLMLVLLLLIPAWAMAEAETVIALSDSGITIDGELASTDPADAVYVSAKTETHEGVSDELKDVANTVVTIAAAGTYRLNGSLTDGQIVIAAPEDANVRLILDGVEITCRTAPALLIESAADPRTENEYGMTIELANGSENHLSGSHRAAQSDEDIDNDGAISSNVSLGFEGTGALEVIGDNEGIEVKYGHLTFNGGEIRVTANDDPVNASEDEVAVLTINDGYLYLRVDEDPANEGDGMDSNGRIVINGGTVIALSHPNSMDSGIDSDLGATVNGGTVISAGNMYDEITAGDGNEILIVPLSTDAQSLITVVDGDGAPVLAYELLSAYQHIVFVLPAQAEDSYTVYVGGEIAGEQRDGLYSDITSYTPGEELSYENSVTGGMGAGMSAPRPGDGNRPMDGDAPERPEGSPPGGRTPPEGNPPEGMPEMPPDSASEDAPEDAPVAPSEGA